MMLKKSLSFIQSNKYKIGLLISSFIYFTFLLDPSIQFVTTSFCSIEVSDTLYESVIEGSNDYPEIKSLSKSMFLDDNKIDLCEYSALLEVYSELNSFKYALSESF